MIKSGTKVTKKVGQTIRNGIVINYNKDTKYYTVKYSDGHYNKMRHRELVNHKCTTYIIK